MSNDKEKIPGRGKHGRQGRQQHPDPAQRLIRRTYRIYVHQAEWATNEDVRDGLELVFKLKNPEPKPGEKTE